MIDKIKIEDYNLVNKYGELAAVISPPPKIVFTIKSYRENQKEIRKQWPFYSGLKESGNTSQNDDKIFGLN